MTLAELLRRLASRGHRRTDTGVVDQDVDAAELLDRSRDQRARSPPGFATSVATAIARRPERLDHGPRLGEPVDPARAQRDIRAGLGQRLARRRHQDQTTHR